MRSGLISLMCLAISCSSPRHSDLSSTDPAKRREAVKALSRATDHVAAVQKLAPILLSDPSEEVRIEATRTLEKLGSPQAIKPLIEAVQSEGTPSSVRMSAFEAIGKLRDPEAVPGLIEMWRMHPRIRDATKVGIERALVDIGAPAIEPLVLVAQSDDADYARSRAFEILEKIGDETIRVRMVALAGSTDQQAAYRARAVIAALDVANMRRRLRSPNPGERREAIRALVVSGTYTGDVVQWIGPVVSTDPDISVRQAAAAALGELHTPAATEILLERAIGLDPLAVRIAALAAIEHSRDPTAIPGLIKIWRMLRGKDDEVAHTAVTKALVSIGAPATEALAAVVRTDPSERVRDLASDALTKLRAGSKSE